MEMILNGGNMNAPVLIGNAVHRVTTDSTETIHRLLNHLKVKGIDWIPEVRGFDDSGREILSFIHGEVPHQMPRWVWSKENLITVARAMRQLHDATADFNFSDAHWELPSSHPVEVICHNDFAPYNCVFENGKFKGLFDFDMCSPGSRLWDIAYCAYRYIPLMPNRKNEISDEISPFNSTEMLRRTEIFLKTYSGENKEFEYTEEQLFNEVSKRLVKLSEWTADFAEETDNDELRDNAEMYKYHSMWILNQN